MALSRRTGTRFQASIWPGFVDAMTGLLLVMMFLLTIFMVVQFVLRDTISGQETILDKQAAKIDQQTSELDKLSSDVVALSEALGLERDRSADLDTRVGELTSTIDEARSREEEQARLIASLQSLNNEQDQALNDARTRIASFEDQVASLLAGRDSNLNQIADLEGARDALLTRQEALQLALAGLRDEVDSQAEAARLAAAKRQALDALVADLQRKNTKSEQANADLSTQVTDLESQLSEEEKNRLLEAAAAEALRDKLKNADAELTAMTLSMEEQRRKAEETLAMLAAAQKASEDLDVQLAAALLARDDTQQALDLTQSDLSEKDAEIIRLQKQLAEALAAKEAATAQALDADEVRKQLAAALAAKLAAEQASSDQLSQAELRAALLAQARQELANQAELTTEAQKQQTLLNQQVLALRQQLSGLQGLLDDAKARDAAADVQLESLGKNLNIALARAAAEERKRRKLEEEKRVLLEAETKDLQKYRSEFFGRLRDVMGAQEGVKIVGDRFVFSSEVLFAPGRATLSENGQLEIAKVARILGNVLDEIPDSIDWIIRVDGHTDNVPLSGGGKFADNWELSQARALSVVRYMIDTLGLPPDRLSANGFGEFQPINPADTPEARAQNRRIELKFTEK